MRMAAQPPQSNRLADRCTPDDGTSSARATWLIARPCPRVRAGSERVVKLSNNMRDVMHDRRDSPLSCIPGSVSRVGPTGNSLIALRECLAVILRSSRQEPAVAVHLVVAQAAPVVRLRSEEHTS